MVSSSPIRTRPSRGGEKLGEYSPTLERVAWFTLRRKGIVTLVWLGAAIGTCNVVLPALIKRDFAHRSGLMTGLYSMTLSGGAAVASGVSVPINDAPYDCSGPTPVIMFETADPGVRHPVTLTPA